MTVAEVIKKVDALRRNNSFTIEEKMLWLNQCEAKVQLDCLLMSKVEVQYKYGADNEEELIAPTPYDDLYVYYICARIDEALDEMAMYNDSITAFNDVHGNFQKWLIKTYNPARNRISVKRSVPEIYRGEKVYITLYGLPIDAGNIEAAVGLITQDEATTEITEVKLEDKTLSFLLTEAGTYALSEGTMYAGFDITDSDGYRYKDEKVQRFQMVLSPELSGSGDNEGGSAVDASLTIDGRAADAGATGARIGAAETRLTSAENKLTEAETSLTEKEAKGLVSADYELFDLAEVEAKIVELTAAMDDKAVKYFTWLGTGTDGISSGVPYAPAQWMVKIEKLHSSNYAIVEMETYMQGGVKVRNVMSAGAFSGWEWINPPMAEGVEYRTTERHLGKAVYVKTINVGELPNASHKTVSHYLTVTGFVRAQGIMSTSDGIAIAFPTLYRNGETQQEIGLLVNAAYIIITTDYDASDRNGKVRLWYTKD